MEIGAQTHILDARNIAKRSDTIDKNEKHMFGNFLRFVHIRIHEHIFTDFYDYDSIFQDLGGNDFYLEINFKKWVPELKRKERTKRTKKQSQKFVWGVVSKSGVQSGISS